MNHLFSHKIVVTPDEQPVFDLIDKLFRNNAHWQATLMAVA